MPYNYLHVVRDAWSAPQMRRVPAKLTVALCAVAIVALVAYREVKRTAEREVEYWDWLSMGTLAELQTRDHSIARAEAQIMKDAFSEVEEALSVFRDGSDLSRLVADGTITVSSTSHLARVLNFALKVAEGSGGAFDPTVAPLMEAWGFRGLKVSDPPSATSISNILANSVGWRRVEVADSGDGRTVIASGGTRLDLGGIAKGYAIDVAYERLRDFGGENFLINLGGNIRVSGTNGKGGGGWTVAMRNPLGATGNLQYLPRQLRSGEAVATSGSYERFIEINGKRYSHIIDPRTGMPVDNEQLASTTVIAPTAIESDAYSTTLFVLGEEEGRRFIDGKDGCQAFFIGKNAIGLDALRRVEALCALGQRNALTPGAHTAAKWIADELAAIGLEPEIDEFNDPAPDGSERVFRNVLATARGTCPGRVLLLSHYDTKSGISDDFTGANDGGSSTGLLLALAKHLAVCPAAPYVTFAFLDGEECVRSYGEHDGLHGSRHLAKRLRGEGAALDAVILLDMIGDRDLTLTLPRNGDAELKRRFLSAADQVGRRGAVRLLQYDMVDDHQPFIDAGYKAIDIIDFEYGSLPGLNDYWHTPADTPDKLSAESLQAVGDIVLHMIDGH